MPLKLNIYVIKTEVQGVEDLISFFSPSTVMFFITQTLFIFSQNFQTFPLKLKLKITEYGKFKSEIIASKHSDIKLCNTLCVV